MHTTTVHALVHKQIEHALGHLIYVVHAGALVFYIGQSKRDLVARFWEHLQKPTRLGEFITLNKPDSLAWAVDFYTLAECRPFVVQKSLFAMQAWEHFDMDMAEQGLITALRPVINRDFNPNPTPLPASYHGRHLAAHTPTNLPTPQYRLWLNRISLAGWVYIADRHGHLTWRHRDGRTLSDAQMAPFRENERIP